MIDGSQETEGEPGFPPVGDFDDEWYPPAEIGTPHKPFDFDQCLLDWDSYRRCFRALEDSEPAEETEEEAEAAIPAITINDLARFAPEGSVVTGEPDNVGVAGLPTNFVTAASAQTVDAELFGFPISVRFTPSAYDFTYGDGDSATTSTGGSTWAALGQAQFTPTDTGHTYRERGTYFAQVDVRYTAEVDFGVGWYPISGEVTTTGAPQQVRIFEAHTALVAFTCAEAPNSPGC
ncbi:hypothetical protein [Microbacterium sp.]|uniref:hypothetical protein n=1 Tax=Microbacterium sp. TaxID=51671 RepID=UPI003F9695C1